MVRDAKASDSSVRPLVGIVALVGVVVNLAHHSVQQDLDVRAAPKVG